MPTNHESNHPKLAIKNLLGRDKTALLSILGLAIALVSTFYIYSYVSFELSYDSYNQKAKGIYRISGDIIAAENTATHAVLGPLMSPELKNYFPQVESFTRLVPICQQTTMEYNHQQYIIEEAYSAAPDVFNIFTFEFIYGDGNNIFRNPDEVVINESLSEKIFGDTSPIGESLIRDGHPLKIVGVVKDSPENSHHKLNVLFSLGDRWTNLENASPIQLSEAYWMPAAISFILSLYLQYIKGISPVETGVLLIIQPVLMIIFSTFSGRWSDKIDPRILPTIGMSITVVGLIMLTLISQSTSNIFIGVSLAIMGSGFGLFSSPNTNSVIGSVSKPQTGIASATLGSMRLTGQMITIYNFQRFMLLRHFCFLGQGKKKLLNLV